MHKHANASKRNFPQLSWKTDWGGKKGEKDINRRNEVFLPLWKHAQSLRAFLSCLPVAGLWQRAWAVRPAAWLPGGARPGTGARRESKKILYFWGRIPSSHFHGAASINFYLSDLETKCY